MGTCDNFVIYKLQFCSICIMPILDIPDTGIIANRLYKTLQYVLHYDVTDGEITYHHRWWSYIPKLQRLTCWS